MKSFENDAHGSTKDAFRPRLAGLGRRDLMKGGVGIAVTQAPSAWVTAIYFLMRVPRTDCAMARSGAVRR